MHLTAHFPTHKIWAGAQPDIGRIVEIWTECLATNGGPYFFGAQRNLADAIYAPVAKRFLTYDVRLNPGGGHAQTLTEKNCPAPHRGDIVTPS
jgi:glutathione S-transferase